jgi:hypothetical protein
MCVHSSLLHISFIAYAGESRLCVFYCKQNFLCYFFLIEWMIIRGMLHKTFFHRSVLVSASHFYPNLIFGSMDGCGILQGRHDTQHKDTQHNSIQHNNIQSITTFNIAALSITTFRISTLSITTFGI